MRRAGPIFVLFALAGSMAVTGFSRAAAPTLKLDPDAGSGRAGESFLIKGGGFPSSSTLLISIGGSSVVPEGVLTDASGRIAPGVVSLSQPLPAGRHGAIVGGPSGIRLQNIYRVRPHVTLDPPIGDGRPGATWRTDSRIPTGGRMGMVFSLKGSGFPAGSFIPADSIRIGSAGCVHDPVRVGDDGILTSTTIVIASELKGGRYDLAFVHEGGRIQFSSVFHVAPWAVSDEVLKRGAARAVKEAGAKMRKLVSYAGGDLPEEELEPVRTEFEQAQKQIKAKNFKGAEDTARRVTESLELLKDRVEGTRRDKLLGVADVVANGFDTIQPPGAPPNRDAAKTVAQGRKKIEAARSAIERGDLDDARTHLKAGNQLLKKAREESGRRDTKDTTETIRW